MPSRRLKHLIIASVCAFLAVANLTPVAHADTSNFTVDNFAADYTLGEDDPQGTLIAKEQLTVDFTDYNHGILRAIPNRYNSMPQHVHVTSVSRDGASESFTTSTSHDNLVLKIGNPNQTITGLHHYEIDYKVSNVIRFVGNHDELNWNVNGTDWEQPFLHVSAQLHVPSNLEGKLTDVKCFTGATGSTSSDCLVTISKDTLAFTTTQQLSAGQTLTLNSSLPAGYFREPNLADRWADYGPQLLLAVGVPLGALLIAGGLWSRAGRDARGRGTIVPEYAPPNALKPAEIDVLLHNEAGKNAISATIIDLAIRKYLQIKESQTDGVLGIGKHKVYTFVRLAPPAGDTLKDYEQTILDGLFAAGQTVSTDTLKKSFYKTASSVQGMIPKSLAAEGYFARNPAHSGMGQKIVGGLLVFSAFYLAKVNLFLLFGVVLAGVIFFFFGSLMPKRTKQGAAAKDTVEGLKLYLNTAEKDRIAMLQSPNAPYAPQSTEPVKTVELFEKLLPYAMVLGVEKQWAEQFASIYTTPPDWYSGNWSTFNAVYLTNSLSDSMNAMNASFATPSTSSSGFSGGAGGGGGGGGGGGW